ncbi:MAG: ORC1-type DNA replication protein [Candidatus Bathyarchaeia archaeon]
MLYRRSVFRDEAKLDINYVPKWLPHRERELRLLMEFFGFVWQFPDKMAQRVILTGDVGTGKTVLSRRFGAEVTSEAKKRCVTIHYIHVNCREYRGNLFLILQHIISAFHPGFPKRGYSAEELLNVLMQILDEENAYVILALDEFESLIEHEGSEAVYKLTRLQETRPNKPQRLSLICILRDLRATERLDAGTRSTLQYNIISLERYSKEQLIDILSDRVRLAFNPSTVFEDVISLIADLASSEGGNARFAIELLWRAGKYADAEGLDAVTPECVRKAVSGIIPTLPKSELAHFGLHEKLFLLGVARLFKESGKAHVSLVEAEKAYCVVCEEFDVQPHSHTQLWKYLRFLSGLDILKTEVLNVGVRGRSTIIYLPRISAYELEKELTAILEKAER